MSDKVIEQNLTDNMKQRGKKQKEKQQNVTDKKRKSLEEDEGGKPLNPKRHRGGDSCSDSTGSTSAPHSAEDPSSEDASSTGSFVLDAPMLEMNREAECYVRPERPKPGFSGRCDAVAGNSGAGPRTKAKQKIWYREATSTTYCSTEKDVAMEDE